MSRNRAIYLGFIVLIIVVGLSSRTSIIPKFIYPYLGDYFYALMMFFIVGFLFPNMKIFKVTCISICICYLIELLQLYQSEWINEIRNSLFGRLVLGSGFLWSDIISYTFGGITGFVIEKMYYRRSVKSNS